MNATLDNLNTHPTNTHPTRPHPTDQKLILRRPSQSGENTIPVHDRRLLLLLELINDNMQRQLTIRGLARVVNLSPGRLAHLFKSEVGISPQRYLNNVRLEKAKELLESGMLSVKEVAAEIGFPHASSFCRSFKACYSTTPREYRKNYLRIDIKTS
jgi:AraC family transcriptional regulator, arabinose operon regulatory protein